MSPARQGQGRAHPHPALLWASVSPHELAEWKEAGNYADPTPTPTATAGPKVTGQLCRHEPGGAAQRQVTARRTWRAHTLIDTAPAGAGGGGTAEGRLQEAKSPSAEDKGPLGSCQGRGQRVGG